MRQAFVRWITTGLATIAAGLASSAVRAADLPPPSPPPPPPAVLVEAPTAFFVHIGPGGLFLDSGAKAYTPAGRIPGASVNIPPQVTAIGEVGYFFTPEWAVAATLGVPPTAKIEGAGTIAGYGKLGSVLYGPVAVTGQYHFRQFGAIQPYLGIGPAYEIAFKSHDAVLTDLDVHSAWGGVIQGGVDVMVSRNVGVFFDVKKAYLRTEASGRLGPYPIHADVKLDPLVLSSGLTFRF